ncbi:hypothetical protein HPULCUR_011119 [Helicostylum pulchrum]|uniref:Oxidoreductase-like domain-containing protein n=1 Tax=Helicostylum pulchrum TaxID=562976 RepID=A0ABP9YF63_9FUNG
MSLQFIRSLHYKRVPNYDGWWTQILNRSIEPKKSISIEQVPVATSSRVRLAIPFEQIPEETVTLVPTTNTTVYLNGTPIKLPEKPSSPDNCCMSVWDMYGEDMEEYALQKTEIRNRFKEAGVALPKELEKNSQNDAMEEMDPSMKAFLDMEKKLKNM